MREHVQGQYNGNVSNGITTDRILHWSVGIEQKYTTKYNNVGYGWDTSHPTTISKKSIILIYHYLHIVSFIIFSSWGLKLHVSKMHHRISVGRQMRLRLRDERCTACNLGVKSLSAPEEHKVGVK